MRNLFDQYSQPENRITHALVTALDQDRVLLASFLKDLIRVRPPVGTKRLALLEQRFPGEDEPDEDDLQRRGIPDVWIFDEDSGWCVIIETKVLARLNAAQVESHLRTAARRGFRSVKAVAIVPRPSVKLPPEVTVLEWRTIYAWLKSHASQSVWAARASEYLEIAEAKLIDKQQFVEGTLTTFAGFPFGLDHPYTYLEGKRLLKLARIELQARRDLRKVLGMNPAVEGRGHIKGRQADAVWDFLSLSSAPDAQQFTKYPHLTLNVASHAVEAMVTIPNSVNTKVRRAIRELGLEGFEDMTSQVVKNLRPLLRAQEFAAPWFRGIQRRYPTQSSPALVDAKIDFDLRTALPSAGPPKEQPNWLAAAYGSFTAKRGSNYQIQMGVIFPYQKCPKMRAPEAMDLIVDAWLAFKPLVILGR